MKAEEYKLQIQLAAMQQTVNSLIETLAQVSAERDDLKAQLAERNATQTKENNERTS